MLLQPKWLPWKLKRPKQRWWAALGAHHVAELQPKRPFRQRGAAEMAARRAETAKNKGFAGGISDPPSHQNAAKTPVLATKGGRAGCVSSRNGRNSVGCAKWGVSEDCPPPPGLLAFRSSGPPRFAGAPFIAPGLLNQKVRSSDLWISAASAVFQDCIRCTWPPRLRIRPPNSEIWPFLESAVNAHERVASFSALTPYHRRPSSCAACSPAAPAALVGVRRERQTSGSHFSQGHCRRREQPGAVAKWSAPFHCRKKEQSTVAKKSSLALSQKRTIHCHKKNSDLSRLRITHYNHLNHLIIYQSNVQSPAVSSHYNLPPLN